MKKITVSCLGFMALALPVVALAAGLTIPPAPSDNLNIGSLVLGAINVMWFFFGGFAVFAFIYAGFLFLSSHGDASKVKEARQSVVWAIIGVAVGLLSVSIPLIIKKLLNV